MKLWLALCALSISIAFVAPCEAGLFWRRNVVTRAVAPVAKPQRPREERIIELPEDGARWHLTIANATPALQAYFTAAPRLASLQRQVNYHNFAASHWWAKQHLGANAPPTIMLQTDSGKVIYKASGNNLPRQAEELADEIESAIQGYIASCGPDCQQPNETKPLSQIPDMRRDVETTLDNEDWIVIAGIVAVIAFVIWSRRK